jgi:hypothetical protein
MADTSGIRTRLRQLSDRLDALEAEREIRVLLDRYGWHADHGEHDAWVDLFTADATMTLLGGAPARPDAGTLRWSGAAELAAFISSDLHRAIEGRCMHLPALELRITLDGDRATAEGCSLVVVCEDGRLVLHGAGFTRWDLRREDGRWRIHERVRTAVGAAA